MRLHRFLLLFLLTINGLYVLGQSAAHLVALPVRPAYAPERFVVAQVLDERPEPGTLGTQFGETTPGLGTPRPVPLTLPADALGRFLKASNRRDRDTTRWAIVVRVKKLRFSEKLTTPRQADGQLTATLAFEVLRNGVRTPLTEFEGGGRYNRPLAPTDLHANLLQQTLESALRYLDQWLARNAPGQESLARRVRITFWPDPVAVEVGDTVFYNARRPLVWGDFRAAPRSGTNYGAAVFSSFGYEATSRTVGGVVEVAMAVKVYELKTSSWVWESAKNDYALRHEQLHFDITRLVAERFKQRLRAEDLAPDDYDARIQYLFLDAYREMNRTQEQYDAETAHSVNRVAQARWDAKITGELSTFLAQNP